MLPHTLNATAGRENYDIVHNNLFRVSFVPPAGMSLDPIITEQVLSVTGFQDRAPALQEQQFLQAKRKYAGVAPDDTTQEITIAFTLNRNNQKQNYVWNFIKNWRRLVYDPQTGTSGLKKDYVGEFVVEQFDRQGSVVSTRTFHQSFPINDISGPWDYDVTDEAPKTLEVTFHADWHHEQDL